MPKHSAIIEIAFRAKGATDIKKVLSQPVQDAGELIDLLKEIKTGFVDIDKAAHGLGRKMEKSASLRSRMEKQIAIGKTSGYRSSVMVSPSSRGKGYSARIHKGTDMSTSVTSMMKGAFDSLRLLQTKYIFNLRKEFAKAGDVGKELVHVSDDLVRGIENAFGSIIKDLEQQAKGGKLTKSSILDAKEKFRQTYATGMDQGRGAIKSKQEAIKKGGMLQQLAGNRGMSVAFGTFIGGFASDIGDLLLQGMKKTHFTGRLTQFMSSSVIDVLTGTLLDVGKEIMNSVGYLGEAALELVSGVGRTLTAGFAGMLKGIGTVLKYGSLAVIVGLIGNLGTPLTAVVLAVGAALTGIIEVIKELGSTITNIVTNLIMSIVSLLKAVLTTIVMIIKSIASSIFKIVVSLLTSLKEVAIEFANLIKEITMQIADYLKSSLMVFAQFSEGVKKAFKETIDEFGQTESMFESLALRMSSRFGTAMDDVNKAMFDIVSSGFTKFDDASKIFASSARLATTGVATFGEATNFLITAMQNYKGLKMDEIINNTTVALAKGRMDLSEFANSFKNIGGFAARAKIEFSTLSNLVAHASRFYGQGNIEGLTQHFSRFVEAISMPTPKALAAFKGIGLDLEEISKNGGNFDKTLRDVIDKLKDMPTIELRKFFPTKQSTQFFLALTNDMQGLGEFLKSSSSDARSFTERQYEIMIGSLQRSIDRIKSSFMGLTILIGRILGQSLMGQFKILADNLSKLMEHVTSDVFLKNLTNMTNAIQPIVSAVFYPLQKIFEKIFGSKSLSNFGKVIQYFSELRAFSVRISTAMYKVYEVIKLIVSDLLSFKGSGIFEFILDKVETIIAYLNSFDTKTIITDIKSIMKSIEDFFVNMNFDVIFKNVSTMVILVLYSIFKISKLYIAAIGDYLAEMIKAKIKSGIKAGLSSSAEAVGEVTTMAYGKAKGAMKAYGKAKGAMKPPSRKDLNDQIGQMPVFKQVKDVVSVLNFLSNSISLKKDRVILNKDKTKQGAEKLFERFTSKGVPGLVKELFKSTYEVAKDISKPQKSTEELNRSLKNDLVSATEDSIGGLADSVNAEVKDMVDRIKKQFEDVNLEFKIRRETYTNKEMKRTGLLEENANTSSFARDVAIKKSSFADLQEAKRELQLRKSGRLKRQDYSGVEANIVGANEKPETEFIGENENVFGIDEEGNPTNERYGKITQRDRYSVSSKGVQRIGRTKQEADRARAADPNRRKFGETSISDLEKIVPTLEKRYKTAAASAKEKGQMYGLTEGDEIAELEKEKQENFKKLGDIELARQQKRGGGVGDIYDEKGNVKGRISGKGKLGAYTPEENKKRSDIYKRNEEITKQQQELKALQIKKAEQKKAADNLPKFINNNMNLGKSLEQLISLQKETLEFMRSGNSEPGVTRTFGNIGDLLSGRKKVEELL